MTPEFDDVLLTAYLDDEVNDAEREKVEEQLRTSNASRKLLEELRSVRNLVTQLHLTQSTRSYQQGPWNQANLAIHKESSAACEISKVVLHDPRSHWKLPLQRIASIAALIAIALCGRILLLQPNKPTISLSDGTRTGTRTERDLKTRKEIRPTDESKDLAISDKAFPATGLGGVRSLSESPSRDNGESAVALSVSEGIDGKKLGQEPIPPSPKFQAPNELRDSRSKSQLSEIRPADSAPGSVSSNQPNDLPTLATKPTDPKAQKLLSRSRFSEQYFLDDLLKDQRQEWKTRVIQDVDSLDSKTYDRVDNFVQQGNSNSPKPDEPITKFYFRYRNVNQLGRVTDEPTALLRESATTKESESVEFDKQLAEKQEKVAERPLLVEFEIPSNEWESGAKRLRQLGISVPLELPAVEYLEFTGVPIASEAKKGATESVSEPLGNRSGESRVAGSLELSRWTFQPTDPLEGQRSLERLAEKEATLSKIVAAVMERPSSIRIRVRAISTKEK